MHFFYFSLIEKHYSIMMWNTVLHFDQVSTSFDAHSTWWNFILLFISFEWVNFCCLILVSCELLLIFLNLWSLGGKKYQIKGCAGQGGFAQVFKAYINSNPDEVVALKVLVFYKLPYSVLPWWCFRCYHYKLKFVVFL